MSIELLYTSAPQGLKPSSRGFCTVLSTVGMPVNLATRLEGLSAYRHAFPPNTPEAASNPVCYSHLKMTVGGQRLSVLSRIADYGVDYSQRTNKIAHHVVVQPGEQAPAGPAWVMLQSRVMRAHWDGQCATPPAGPTFQLGNQAPAICQQWHALTGDAGWGAVVAEALAQPTGKPTWIVFSLEQSPRLLGLINEAIALMPERERWQATFSTYVTNLPPDVDCRLRCVLAGTDEARLAPARGKVIDLTQPLSSPVDNRFTEVAVQGNLGTNASSLATSATEAVAATAARSDSVDGGVTASVSASGADEIEHLDDDESSFFGDGAFDEMTSAPPPMPKPPQVRRQRVATSSPLQNKNSLRRWMLVSTIAACALLVVGIGAYLALPKKSAKIGELAMTSAAEDSAEKSEPEPAAAQELIVDSAIPLEAQDESGTSTDDVKVPNTSTEKDSQLPLKGDVTEEQETATNLANQGATLKSSVPEDHPAPANPIKPAATSNSGATSPEAISSESPSPDAIGSAKNTSAISSEKVDNSQVVLTFVATIDADWFDSSDRKITAAGSFELPKPWERKRYFTIKNEPGGQTFKVNDKIEPSIVNVPNVLIQNMKMRTPQSIFGRVIIKNESLADERALLQKTWKTVAAKVLSWNISVQNFLPLYFTDWRISNQNGLGIPPLAKTSALSLHQRAEVSKTFMEAGIEITRRIEDLKKANQQIESMFVQQPMLQADLNGLSDLVVLDRELNESLTRIRSQCQEVDEDLGELFELETENKQDKAARTSVILKLKLSPEKTEK